MKDNFWGLIWSSFVDIQGIIIGFLGIFITIFLLRFSVKTNIPLDLAIIIIFFILLLIATLFNAVSKTLNEYKKAKKTLERLEITNNELEVKVNKRLIPKILYAKRKQSGIEIEFLLENSKLFSNDIFISFYYTDEDEFEVLIGTGVVLTVQENDKIYALMDKPVSAHQDILDKLAGNDAKILKKTVVKPVITKWMIQNFYTP